MGRPQGSKEGRIWGSHWWSCFLWLFSRLTTPLQTQILLEHWIIGAELRLHKLHLHLCLLSTPNLPLLAQNWAAPVQQGVGTRKGKTFSREVLTIQGCGQPLAAGKPQGVSVMIVYPQRPTNASWPICWLLVCFSHRRIWGGFK